MPHSERPVLCVGVLECDYVATLSCRHPQVSTPIPGTLSPLLIPYGGPNGQETTEPRVWDPQGPSQWGVLHLNGESGAGLHEPGRHCPHDVCPSILGTRVLF